MTELWLTYHQASRASLAPTSQLVELGVQKQKLHDLEDVLEYIFQQGFLDPQLRPVSWWEKCDGEKVKGSICVDELLQQGVGKCEQTAMRLVIGAYGYSKPPTCQHSPRNIADIPPAFWLSYHYVHSAGKVAVTQRVKLDALHPYQAGVRPKLAHITNHIFDHGFLGAHFRSRVHWEGVCGKRVEEHHDLFELLSHGEGICEEKAMKLVIGMSLFGLSRPYR